MLTKHTPNGDVQATDTMSHTELVGRAARWLMLARHFPVLKEYQTRHVREVPDVIGWKGCISTLIECKASLSDFNQDQKKTWREGGGLGRFRYYFVHHTLADRILDKLPHGWGLLSVNARGGVVCKREAKDFFNLLHPENRHDHYPYELFLLQSLVKRISIVNPAVIHEACKSLKEKGIVGTGRSKRQFKKYRERLQAQTAINDSVSN